MSTENETRKRPTMVWVISIFVIISVLFGALSIYLVTSGEVSLRPEHESYLSQMTAFDYAITVILMSAQFYAAIELLRLRKLAFYLFSVALAVNVLTAIWHAIDKGFFGGGGQSGLIGALFGWGISLAICIYAWRLMKRDVLN